MAPAVPVACAQWSCRRNRRSRRSAGGFGSLLVERSAVRRPLGQCAQPLGAPPSSAVRKLEPQPHAATAFGLLTVNPAPISVST